MAIQAQTYQQQTPWFVSQDSQLQTIPKNQILNSQLDQQGMNFDQLLHFQTERLRVELQEQRKKHTIALLKTLKSKAQLILNQKDQELAAAAHRTTQLQSLMQKLEAEGHAWRKTAEENDAVVASLNNTLEELSRDRESHCGGANEESGTTELCKNCNAWGSCVLFLPCRHLCSCKACEPLLGFCPVCRTAKKATVEAIF